MSFKAFKPLFFSLVLSIFTLSNGAFAFSPICKIQMTKVPNKIKKVRNKWAQVTMPDEFKNFDYELFEKSFIKFNQKTNDDLLNGTIDLEKKNIEEQLGFIKAVSSKIHGEYKILQNVEFMTPIQMKKMARDYLGLGWWTFGKNNQSEYRLQRWINRQISLEYYTPHSWRTALTKGFSREERIDDMLGYIFQKQALYEGILPTIRKNNIFKKNNFLEKINTFFSHRKVKLATIFLLNQNLLFKTPRGYFLKIELIDLSKKELQMIFEKPGLESFEIIRAKYKKILNINITYNRYRKFLNSLVGFYIAYSVYNVYSEEEKTLEQELEDIRSGKVTVDDGELEIQVPDDLMDNEAGNGALGRWVKEKYPNGASEKSLLNDPEYLEMRYLYLGIEY